MTIGAFLVSEKKLKEFKKKVKLRNRKGRDSKKLSEKEREDWYKFFNKENSIQNFGEQIGYTQGVGLSYNIEFDNLKEFLEALFKKQQQKIKFTNPSGDNTSIPKFMNFKENISEKPANN